MTVSRMARRFAIALASGLAVAASAVAAQDTLTHAKDLYASAAYDEALAVLERLHVIPSSSEVAEIGEYRAFCLLALGRTDEGRRVIRALVESNPLFVPSEEQTSPRLLAVFRDVRRQLLPQIVRDTYAAAKSAFDKKELQAAATGFDRVLVLLKDPDSTESEGLADIRMLATGFKDLSAIAMTAVRSTASVSPAAPSATATPTPEAPPDVPEPRRTYGPDDASVIAPVVVSQTLPPWRYSKLAEAHRQYPRRAGVGDRRERERAVGRPARGRAAGVQRRPGQSRPLMEVQAGDEGRRTGALSKGRQDSAESSELAGIPSVILDVVTSSLEDSLGHQHYELQPIGRVESPIVDRAAPPKQGDEGSPDAWLAFDARFSQGLRDLQVGDEIILLLDRRFER